ncbi:MAG: hypothetical protein HQK72_00800 [Desulfamplus sp.]|nr:hypothetical protein [Desulfamplus sp.]
MLKRVNEGSCRKKRTEYEQVLRNQKSGENIIGLNSYIICAIKTSIRKETIYQ